MDCLCCQEVKEILQEEGNECITMPKQFQTLCLEKLVLKKVLVGLYEATKDTPEKENKLKDIVVLLPVNNLYGGYTKDLGKEAGELSHHVFLWKIGHYPEANGQYFLYKGGKKD